MIPNGLSRILPLLAAIPMIVGSVMRDLFLEFFPNKKFSLHIHYDGDKGGVFDFRLPADSVDLIYNYAMHGKENSEEATP